MAQAVRLDNIHRVKLVNWDVKEQLSERYGYQPLDSLITLGTSLGGPNTIIRLFSSLSPNLPAAGRGGSGNITENSFRLCEEIR